METLDDRIVPNADPIAFDVAYSLHPSNPAFVTLIPNATDADGDSLELTTITGAANGSITFAGQSVYYTPNPGFTGTEQLAYTVIDGNSGSGSAAFTITVTNAAPTVADLHETIHAGQPLALNLYPTDADGDAVQIAWGSALHGTVTGGANDFHYQPNPGFLGTEIVPYTATDSCGAVSTATITIDVTNTAPVAYDHTYYMLLRGTMAELNPLDNATDADGDALTIAIAAGPMHGAITLNSYSVFEYVPASDFVGNEMFQFVVSDSFGGVSLKYVTMQIVNRAPIFSVSGGGYGVEDNVAPIYASGGDADNDPLIFVATVPPQHGVFTSDGMAGTFTPYPNWNGTENFTVVAFDGYDYSDPIAISVTVAAVNDAPEAQDFSLTTPMNIAMISNIALTGNVLDGATDVDGDTLSASISSYPSHGSVALDLDGSFEYTPNSGHFGSDGFNFVANDGQGGTSSIHTVAIDVVNQAPVSTDIEYQTNEDTPIAFTVTSLLAKFTDAEGDPISFVDYEQPENGSVALDGVFTYTPSADFNGQDYFLICVADSSTPEEGDYGYGYVFVNVLPINDAPVALEYGDTTYANLPFDIYPTSGAGDVDGDVLTILSFTQPSHGTLTLNGDGVSLHYVPETDWVGPDGFGYTISDGHGGTASNGCSVGTTPFDHTWQRLWLDRNGNGSQDYGEEGIAGATVQMWDVTTNELVGEAATSSNPYFDGYYYGSYSMDLGDGYDRLYSDLGESVMYPTGVEGVIAHDYRMLFINPDAAKYDWTTPHMGPTWADSDADAGGWSPAFQVGEGMAR